MPVVSANVVLSVDGAVWALQLSLAGLTGGTGRIPEPRRLSIALSLLPGADHGLAGLHREAALDLDGEVPLRLDIAVAALTDIADFDVRLAGRRLLTAGVDPSALPRGCRSG